MCFFVKPKYISNADLLVKPVQCGQNNIQFDLSIVLKDVPTKINLFDKQFSLKGLINFIQSPKCMNMNDMGYYA
jgi:hypothetical protein